MRIGEVAKHAGIGVGADLRPDTGTTPPDVVLDLRFIRRAKDLGFTLNEIQELLSLDRGQDASASDVRDLAGRKLADIEEKIRSLPRMRRALQRAVDECPGRGPTTGCSILRALAKAE